MGIEIWIGSPFSHDRSFVSGLMLLVFHDIVVILASETGETVKKSFSQHVLLSKIHRLTLVQRMLD